MERMTVGSLFAGIGGLEYGLERAGMEVKWQVENDAFCNLVLDKHWPTVKRYGNINEVGAHNLASVDLICGGFPCQPISLIGRRKGENDERWLWPEFARIVCELRPHYVIVENVTSLLARGMDMVLGDLAKLGYDAEWEVLPAGAFGARHIRKRTFVVAYTVGKRLETRDGETEDRRRRPILRVAPPSNGIVRWDITEPPILTSVDGVPNRVARCKAAGNAIVPQVAEWIGRQILTAQI